MGILDFHRVPDKALPERLSEGELNATYASKAEVPGLIATATTGKLDKTEAASTYAKIPDVVLRARREGARAATPALAGLLRRFMAAKTTTWSDPNVWRVRALTKRGRRLVGVKHDDTNGLIIGYSDNDGGTWTQTYQFAPSTAGRAEALIVLNDGEVLVAVRTNAGDYDAKIYKSTGFDSNPATATWVMVFDTPFAQATTVPHGMYRGLAYDGQDTVAGAWYDKKTLSGSTVYGDTAGVRVRRSLDKGVTWTEVFNLRTWLLGRGVAADGYGHHVHSITYDPFTDGWLLSYGDSDSVLGQSGILHFSKDFATITVLYYGIGPWQAVTMYALADCILTMGDGGTSGGVNRIPRKEDGTFGSFEKAYPLDQAIGTGGYHASIGDFVVIPISQIAGTTPLSRILVTADGYTFHEFYVDTTYTVSSINGFQFAVGPTASGKIIATSVNDGRYAGSTSQLTITPS